MFGYCKQCCGEHWGSSIPLDQKHLNLKQRHTTALKLSGEAEGSSITGTVTLRFYFSQSTSTFTKKCQFMP